MARTKTHAQHSSQVIVPGKTVRRGSAGKGKGKGKGKTVRVSSFKGYKASGVGGVKRAMRYRPGTVALREIRRWQNSTQLILPFKAFLRVVKDVALEISPFYRFQSTAIKALQEATESFLVELFEDAQDEACHARRVTVMVRDIQIVLRVRRVRRDRFTPHRHGH